VKISFTYLMVPELLNQRQSAENLLHWVEMDALMNSLQDRDIGTVWAEHFPKCRISSASRALCLTIFDIVQNKAQISLPLAGSAHKLIYVLRTVGIPEKQFNEMNGIAKDILQSRSITRLFADRRITRLLREL
jgi:hypothetical protein